MIFKGNRYEYLFCTYRRPRYSWAARDTLGQRAALRRQGAVQDTKVWLFDTATAIEKLPKVIASDKRYFVIGKSPVTLQRIEAAGISLKNANGKINVGPMSARADTRTIGPNQSVNAEEIAAFDWLVQHGHLVEFRLVPDAGCYSWQDARQKLK